MSATNRSTLITTAALLGVSTLVGAAVAVLRSAVYVVARSTLVNRAWFRYRSAGSLNLTANTFFYSQDLYWLVPTNILAT